MADKEIDEILDEVGFGQADPPEGSEDTGAEAANSGNVRVYINGYSAQLTFRRNTAMGVIKVVKRVVQLAEENGWKTSWKEDESPTTPTTPNYGSGKPAVLGKLCPVHAVPMVNRMSKTKGKPYWVHFDPATNKPCFGKGYMA